MWLASPNSRLAKQQQNSRTITIEERKRLQDVRGRDSGEIQCSLALFSFLAIVPHSYSYSSSPSDSDPLRTERKYQSARTVAVTPPGNILRGNNLSLSKSG